MANSNPNRLIKIVDSDDAECAVSFTDHGVLLWVHESPTQLTRTQARKLGHLLVGFANRKEKNEST